MELKRVHSLESYCCLELVRAVEGGYLTEVVSGILIDKSTGGLEIPRAKYCPFCSAEIIYISRENYHSWKTEKRQ